MYSSYNSSGFYISSRYIVSDYTGDWLIIQLPNRINLTGYYIRARYTFEVRAPGEFKVYGSNDGSTFAEIPGASMMNRLTAADYSSSITVSFPASDSYSYIGFVVNKLAGSAAVLVFDELFLFGTEQYNELVPASQAVLCPAGSTAPVPCPVSFYCPDSMTSLPCTAGNYCPGNSSAPVPCPAGKYSPTTGASACTLCPLCTTSGYFRSGCSGTAVGTCEKCTNTV